MNSVIIIGFVNTVVNYATIIKRIMRYMAQQDIRRTEVISDFPTLGSDEYILRHFC